MSFFGRLFGKKHNDIAPTPPSMPWDRHPSILEFLRTHITEGTPGMIENGYTLPDEERVGQGSRLRFAPGAFDGMVTHHLMSTDENDEDSGTTDNEEDTGRSENDEVVHKTVELVVAYSSQPTAKNKAAIYQHVIAAPVVSSIDPVMEALLNEKAIGHDRL